MLPHNAVAAVCLTVLVANQAMAQQAPLVFTSENVGAPGSNKAAELFLPPGDGPFPVVITLHPCIGIGMQIRAWARRLVGWGYASFVIDSFRPRGVANTCGQGLLVPPPLRVRDALAGAGYLRTLPSIDADRIGLLGFSHGGWTGVRAAQKFAANPDPPPWKAVVAIYPWCPDDTPPLMADLQIIIGDADDWTPAKNCSDMVARYQAAGSPRVPALKVYPGVHHSFDARVPEGTYFGHHIRFDPGATADAVKLTQEFFNQRLKR